MKAWPITLALLAVGVLLLAGPALAFAPMAAADAPADPAAPEPDAVDQLPSVFETVTRSMDPSSYLTGTLNGDEADANARAFLDMLAFSEGTAGRGDDGYNVMFGGATFDSYADHPRQVITRTFGNGKTVASSAAGRYQFLAKTWDALAAKLALPDFSPASQDAAALELVREHGALADVRAGRFSNAVAKLNTTWASLPGSPYGQPTHDLQQLADAFAGAGGVITA